MTSLHQVKAALAVTRRLVRGNELWMFVVMQDDAWPLDEHVQRTLIKELASAGGTGEEFCRVFRLSSLPITKRGKVMGRELERLINHQALPNRERMKNPEIIAEITRAIHTNLRGYGGNLSYPGWYEVNQALKSRSTSQQQDRRILHKSS